MFDSPQLWCWLFLPLIAIINFWAKNSFFIFVMHRGSQTVLYVQLNYFYLSINGFIVIAPPCTGIHVCMRRACQNYFLIFEHRTYSRMCYSIILIRTPIGLLHPGSGSKKPPLMRIRAKFGYKIRREKLGKNIQKIYFFKPKIWIR